MASRKSANEARVERVTWGLMVAVCAAAVMAEPGTIANGLVPMICGVILLASAIYQYMRRWKVSPFTWMLGTALIGLGGAALYYVNVIRFNLTGVALLIVVIVILLGVFTGET